MMNFIIAMENSTDDDISNNDKPFIEHYLLCARTLCYITYITSFNFQNSVYVGSNFYSHIKDENQVKKRG